MKSLKQAIDPLIKLYLFNFNTATLAVFQAVISLRLATLESWSFGYAALHLVVSIISVVALFQLWNAFLAYFGRKKSIAFNLVFTGVYIALQIYHFVRHESLTYLLIHKNGHDLLNVEGVGFVLSNISAVGWLLLVVALVAIAALHWRFGIFASAKTLGVRSATFAALLALNIALPFVSVPASNEYVQFISSVKRFYTASDDVPKLAGDGAFLPYVKIVEANQEVNISEQRDKPNVFIVMLESFSAYYMEREENGRKVTPFLDSLLDKGFYAEQFFSASVETSKGQFATLCSVYPAYKANVFTSYYKNNFRCLPEILQDNGYETVFLKAYHSLDFENTGSFVKHNGFDHYYGMDKKFVTPEERKMYKFGWGIQDNIFYQKTFEFLDDLKVKQSKGKPFFVTTMSVTNHMNFDKIPDDQKFIYPDADGFHQNYTNSMHLTDLYLKEFFKQLEARDYLKNSIVVVTGDNGFPMGQHNKNFHNTRSAYNEMFKMPLLVLWPEKLPAKRVREKAFSQLDIAPTIMQLLGIKTSHHFVGSSVLKPQTEDYFVPLIQPFDGRLLASIRYPYKYIQRQRDGKQHFFNLESDPAERQNIIAQYQGDPIIKQFQRDLNVLHRNEVLLRENRIFLNEDGGVGVRVRMPTKRVKKGELLSYELIGDMKSEYDILLRVESYNFAQKQEMHSQVLLDPSSRMIAPEILSEGVNRLTFTVAKQGEAFYGRSFDVFVDTPNVTLVSTMKLNGKQTWGKLHRDASVQGNEFKVNSVRYNLGLGVHADSSYSLSLGGEFTLFRSMIALDDESQCGDGASFEVWGDGKQLFESKLLPYKTVETIEVDVTGVQQMELKTKQGSYWGCDHTEWISPVLYTKH